MKKDRVGTSFKCDRDVAKLITRDAEQKRSIPSQIIRDILFKHYEGELPKPPKKKRI